MPIGSERREFAAIIIGLVAWMIVTFVFTDWFGWLGFLLALPIANLSYWVAGGKRWA